MNFEDTSRLLTESTSSDLAIVKKFNLQVKCLSFRSVSSARPEADTSLPPVLHMIWLGSRLPPKFAPNILSYVSLNPDHELWLWLDTSPDTVNTKQQQVRVRDVNKETWSTRDMLDTSTNWAMKSY